MNDALSRLLDRTAVSQSAYWRNLWFPGCVLTRNVLLAPDREVAEMVERLFGAQLRQAMADVVIRVGTLEVPKTTKPKASVFKGGYRPDPERKLYD